MSKLPAYYLGGTSLVLEGTTFHPFASYHLFLHPFAPTHPTSRSRRKKTTDGSQPTMYRRARTCPEVSALWRGTPLSRPAVPPRFAAPRPKIPFASPIKYKPNLVSSRPFTEFQLMDAPWLKSIRPRMTCTEFVDSVWGFAVSIDNFVFGWDWPRDSPCGFSDLPLCRDGRKCLESYATTHS